MTTRTPTGRRRRLGAELRRLREEAGLTIDQVAEVLECSQSKVSRIETGQVSATPRDVRDMLALYRVPDAQREAMVQIAREARQPGWWQKFVDVPDGVPAYVGLETAATSIDVYMSVIVPALLQTADYARAVIGAVRPDLPGAEIDRRVELRLRRQALLDQDHPPALRVLLDDTVLRRPVGGEAVMAAQRRRLLEDAARPAVTLQVLSTRPGPTPGWTDRSRSSASPPRPSATWSPSTAPPTRSTWRAPRTWPATGGCSSCSCRRRSRPRRRPSASPPPA